MEKYKTIDLFAGIGGIRMGFDRAFDNEIDTVFVSEWDAHAQKTYKANFNENIEMEIKKELGERTLEKYIESSDRVVKKHFLSE